MESNTRKNISEGKQIQNLGKDHHTPEQRKCITTLVGVLKLMPWIQTSIIAKGAACRA
jgi:hypothetical protein